MKRLLWVPLLLISCQPAFAEIDLNIIEMIESSGNPNAFNRHSGALGAFQITKVALLDFNQETGARIAFKSLKDPALSSHIAFWMLNDRIPQILRNKGYKPTLESILAGYNCGFRKSCFDHRQPKETLEYIKKYRRLKNNSK